jgi:hypothetical protein
LRKFFDLTELFSGTLYPTANLFFKGFCEIKFLLVDWCDSIHPTIRNMANTMMVKFDKCWGLVLKCYELRTRQHKMLNVNVLRP